MDHGDLEEQFIKEVTEMFLSGKIKYRQTIADGFDKTPQAIVDVLEERI